MATPTDADVETALAVLRAAVPQRDTPASIALREKLMPAVGHLQRREKQRQRASARAAKPQEAAKPPPEAAGPAAGSSAAAVQPSAPDVVTLWPTHFSRLLYPNPVCFLSSWGTVGGRARRNLMTISWLTAVDNDGRFVLSMNRTRFSARLLAANPTLVLSVAVAGLEPTLLKIAYTSGAKMQPDKPHALRVRTCRPGWGSLAEEGDAVPLSLAEARAGESGDGKGGNDGGGEFKGGGGAGGEGGEGEDAGGWPADGDPELVLATDEGAGIVSGGEAFGGAFAVEGCAAHLHARITSVRAAHGHYTLFCRTAHAYVRSEYWSGKTLEPQAADVPPILTFLGSQRFGYVAPTPAAALSATEPSVERALLSPPQDDVGPPAAAGASVGASPGMRRLLDEAERYVGETRAQ